MVGIIGLISFVIIGYGLVPLSQGILLGSINIIAIMVVGRIIFKEAFTLYRIAGMLFITGGVILVGLS